MERANLSGGHFRRSGHRGNFGYNPPMSRPSLENFRSPSGLLLFVGTTVVGLLLDLWIKSYAFAHLVVAWSPNLQEVQSRDYQFIPGWLHFHATANHGAVFGLGQGQRPLFLIVSILAIGFLSYLFAASGRQRFYQFLLGLLLAGVLGNLYDRIVLGYVRDMIYIFPNWPNPLRGWFPSWQELFPWIFNLADAMLCAGVALMILYSLFLTPREPITDDPRSEPT